MKDIYIGIVCNLIDSNYVEVKVFSNHFNNENPSVIIKKESNVEVVLHDQVSFEKRDDKYYLISTNVEEVFCKVLVVQYFEDLKSVMFIAGKKDKRFRVLLEDISEDLKLVIPNDNLYIYYDKGNIIRVEVKYQKNSY